MQAKRELDPSRTVQTFQRQAPTRFQLRVPQYSINLPWPQQGQPPQVMSEIQNTGVFKGLSGCGCGGKG